MIVWDNISQPFKHPRRVHSATRLFIKGQAVRIKNPEMPSGNVYLITASLPSSGGSPQYRIRNDDEKFERVAAEAELELVSPSLRRHGDASVESLFGRRQAT
jgi:hypothetical protein